MKEGKGRRRRKEGRKGEKKKGGKEGEKKEGVRKGEEKKEGGGKEGGREKKKGGREGNFCYLGQSESRQSGGSDSYIFGRPVIITAMLCTCSYIHSRFSNESMSHSNQ